MIINNLDSDTDFNFLEYILQDEESKEEKNEEIMIVFLAAAAAAKKMEIVLHCLYRWLAGGSYLDIILSAGISMPSFYTCSYKTY